MIEPSSGGANLRVVPALPSLAPVPERHLDRNILLRGLLRGIAARRRRLAQLETSMVEACERAAARRACRRVRTHDHDTWDKAMWHRYLEAVARLAPDYLPHMRRLLRDIHRFERLLTLPIAAEPSV